MNLLKRILVGNGNEMRKEGQALYRLFYAIIIGAMVFSLLGCSSNLESVFPSTDSESALLPNGQTPAKVYDTIISPDGMYKIEFVGIVEQSLSGGRHPIETIRLVKVDTNETVWKTYGYYFQTILWSLNSRYVAISGTARIYGEVILVDRENLNSITIPLPDHISLKEHNYLEAVKWQSDNELLLLHTDKSAGTLEGGVEKRLVFTIDGSKNTLAGSSVYVEP